MKRNTFIFVVLPEKAVTWAEAQSYCRGNYADLATVSSEDESNKLVMTAQEHYNDSVWIGLYDDINSWRWPLQKEGFYGNGETKFRMWKGGEPNNYMGLEDCVEMDIYGWNDCRCQIPHQFVCYNESRETVASSSYVLVTEFKNWSEAQSHCRQFYTDLVSVRNHTENEEIMKLTQNQSAWNGLYRDSWKWSDGSPASFKKWIPPYDSENAYINKSCVVLHKGQWEAHKCEDKLHFVCNAVTVTQQVVKVKVTKNMPSVNLEDTTEAMLQQFGQILKVNGLGEDMQLTWRKQLDGKIFYLDKKEEKKEPVEIICSFE